MKAAILSLFTILIFQSQATYSKTLIISDVDDTIKMTDVLGSKKKIFFNGVFREKAFSGMSQLYQQFNNENTIIHYVSGSPKIIRIRVDEFLEENEFPQQYNLSLRNSLYDATKTFKLSAIKRIIEKEQPEKIILIGDDTEHDPEIYASIADDYPGLVDSIYIRSIKNREMPKLAIIKTFFSAVEIAAYEMLQARMSKESFIQVAQAFIYRFGRSGIFLTARYCPKSGRDEITLLAAQFDDEKIRSTLNKVQNKIIKSCH